MSRLGVQPAEIPSGVLVTLEDGVLSVKGPKGELSRSIPEDVTVTVTEDSVKVDPARTTIHSRALWGTYASHVRNMLAGVTDGFEKKLEVEGVGYKAEAQADKVVLNVGYSHSVELPIPEGVSVNVEKNVITVSGINKEVVGQFAANIRATREPEPYKGKGIHYEGEYIIRKQGKRAVS